MRKAIPYVLCVVIVAILLLSIFYLFSYHEYDLIKVEEVTTDETYTNITYDKQEKIEDESVLGILTIDKIGLKATVKEGSTKEILKDYIGHIAETDQYDGNIGLAAHNRWNEYSYFARLNELKKGDIIIYQTKFYTRTYQVIKKVVIYDTDWSYLQKTKDNRLTLITCIANKPNQRLCVQAVEIKEE